MTKSLSHWLDRLSSGFGLSRVSNFESVLELESDTLPGVEFSIRKISLAQRIELTSRVRELTLRNEFLKAGELENQLDSAVADLLVQKLYVEWAVVDLRGLTIDGRRASVELLIERGPSELIAEMVEAIRGHLELSDAERKNFPSHSIST